MVQVVFKLESQEWDRTEEGARVSNARRASSVAWVNRASMPDFVAMMECLLFFFAKENR